jgi:hypothetical protein
VGLLKSNFICLREEESDTLCWSKNPINDKYTAKLEYLSLAEAAFGEAKRW